MVYLLVLVCCSPGLLAELQGGRRAEALQREGPLAHDLVAHRGGRGRGRRLHGCQHGKPISFIIVVIIIILIILIVIIIIIIIIIIITIVIIIDHSARPSPAARPASQAVWLASQPAQQLAGPAG